ncbi:MAG: hypothetical protein QG602_1599 [Verrucomicrobiota bacterium]|nr:hypothetical protein [Verrucomicrobiota bacterium]
MNIHHLLHQRDALLRQARLANVAYAYQRMGEFAGRIARARLCGAVALRAGDPTDGLPWPGLSVIDVSPAVLEEHFLDEELVELTDILVFLGEEVGSEGLTLRLEELAERFLPQLRRELAAAAIRLEGDGRAGIASGSSGEQAP